MRFGASLFASVLGLAACGGSSATSGAESAPVRVTSDAEGDAIVAKMKERYASAKTYVDEGTFRVVYRETNGREKQTITGRFRTRWRAPDRMSFVMEEDPSEFHHRQTIAMWTPRAGEIRVLAYGKEQSGRSLAQSLGELHGVSNALTGVVPLWLVEGFHSPRHFERKGSVPCGDGQCYALEALSDVTDRTMLLVDTRTFALRRLVRHTVVAPKELDADTLASLPAQVAISARLRNVEPFMTDDDVTFAPRFDETIDDSAFDYEPAASSKASSSQDRSAR